MSFLFQRTRNGVPKLYLEPLCSALLIATPGHLAFLLDTHSHIRHSYSKPLKGGSGSWGQQGLPALLAASSFDRSPLLENEVQGGRRGSPTVSTVPLLPFPRPHFFHMEPSRETRARVGSSLRTAVLPNSWASPPQSVGSVQVPDCEFCHVLRTH